MPVRLISVSEIYVCFGVFSGSITEEHITYDIAADLEEITAYGIS